MWWCCFCFFLIYSSTVRVPADRADRRGRRAPVSSPIDRHSGGGIRSPRRPARRRQAGEAPSWGRWFRQVDARRRSGTAIMSGDNGAPLLVLDRVGKGRVGAAALRPDVAVGARLRRRRAAGRAAAPAGHWLMKEPDLEENDLRAAIEGDQLKVTRQSLEPDDSPVTVTAPDGTTRR